MASGPRLRRPERTDDKVGTVPTDLLLLMIGRQAERALGERLS